MLNNNNLVEYEESFASRHIGSNAKQIVSMLESLDFTSLEQLVEAAVPSSIALNRALLLPLALTETKALENLKAIASENQIFKSYIGCGYYNCYLPGVIQRNILECPGWYTAYTPYQAEIAQGRLEALLNFQTMIVDLCGLEIANASLLDEGTAAAEAMVMSHAISKNKAQSFFVSQYCHPQTIEVVKTRALPLGIQLIIADEQTFEFTEDIFGALLQYPNTEGAIIDYSQFIERAHQVKALVTVAADLLSLTLLRPPGELGADIAVGSTQRFGLPLGYGGPHAAYFATREIYKRQIPGRIVGVSKDRMGKRALRLALQTREQHIKRDRATSNICTAQVLPAVLASMYAVYHGPDGLLKIATRIHLLTKILAKGLQKLGYQLKSEVYFDTIALQVQSAQEIIELALSKKINLRQLDEQTISIALDQTTQLEDLDTLWSVFAQADQLTFTSDELEVSLQYPENLSRSSRYLSEPVFNLYHCETELLRYIHQLESKDISLNSSMIPLGSCTMKLNATAEMIPITWPEFAQVHPHAPLAQTKGYQILFKQLEEYLAEITGFSAISLQPNAGSQGEYAGLQVIRQYHHSRGQKERNICLIPESAHGTNPASAVMCGMKVIPVACDLQGNIDIQDLQNKAEQHSQNLAALMITYPSTHGVFEEGVSEICEIIHAHGAQVYMDGANMNAQVGLCRPADFGADVCHLNLHKTFCIPHGGGGPGMGPIGVKPHLAAFLPRTPLQQNPENSIGLISWSYWGSASILPISWMYIRMMGAGGLTKATAVAILNANYMAMRLAPYYPILFTGQSNLVAHECVIDLRPLKKLASIEVEDVAKRLMDYGFHAPTVSWPVPGTMMIEPTESESQAELDRFCNAMISIFNEVKQIASGELDLVDNPLKNSPHTAQMLLKGEWTHPYSREQAAYPIESDYKFWPCVSRIDNAYGDRHLVCSCAPMDEYT